MAEKLLTPAQVAAALECDRSTIHRRATSNNIGTPTPMGRIYTADDVELLRGIVREQSGNPNFGKVSKRKKKAKR